MSKFEIVGYGRETGRKRVRTYDAETQEDAMEMASSDGTIVEYNKVRKLPEPPATDRQLKYARDLGIKIPRKPTKTQLSELIQTAIDDDMPSKRLVRKATRMGIPVEKSMSATEVEDLIDDEQDRREIEQYDRVETIVQNTREKKWSGGIAAVLSFLIPGLGQLYKGQIFNGLVWFTLTVIGYFFMVIPGLILHLCCIIGAASGDPYA